MVDWHLATPGRERGSMIGKRYRLGDEIGRGAMGVVYRAYDRLTQETVALKRVLLETGEPASSSRSSDAEQSSRESRLALAQEFQTLASLRHPYVISVLDYGFDDQRQPYFTMTLLEQRQDI